MASKMAAKEERFYCVFFIHTFIFEIIILVKFVLIGINVCFLYIICSLKYFHQV